MHWSMTEMSSTLREAIVWKVLVAILSLFFDRSFPRKRSFCERSLAFIVGQASPIWVVRAE